MDAPPPVLAHLPQIAQATLLGKEFLPNLIASPFMVGLRATFYVATVMCIVAAIASPLRGRRYVHNAIASADVSVGSVPTAGAGTFRECPDQDGSSHPASASSPNGAHAPKDQPAADSVTGPPPERVQ